jgi:hypothetical protein
MKRKTILFFLTGEMLFLSDRWFDERLMKDYQTDS